VIKQLAAGLRQITAGDGPHAVNPNTVIAGGTLAAAGPVTRLRI